MDAHPSGAGAEEHEVGEVHVQLMLPSGRRVERRYKSTDGPKQVVLSAISNQNPRNFALFSAHPRQELAQTDSTTFSSLGIQGKILLLLEKCK